MQTSFVQLLRYLMLHFSVEINHHTPEFTYRLLKLSSSLTVPGPRSRSKLLCLEKHCHCSRAFIHGSILIKLLPNVKCDNILNNFEFEGSRAKVKVTVAIFRKKNIVIALAMDQFGCNFTKNV